MAEVKGKLITLATELLVSTPGIRSAAIFSILRTTGKDPRELEPDGWYETKVLDEFLKAVEEYESPLVAWAAIKVIGQKIYPAIDAALCVSGRLRTPLDCLKFEARSFSDNYRGADVVPRKFIEADDHHIILDAPSPGYNCALTEGILDGVLRMCRTSHYTVKQTKCVQRGDSTCRFAVNW
jgi:hypothetical protein